jgi:hypothetical protein
VLQDLENRIRRRHISTIDCTYGLFDRTEPRMLEDLSTRVYNRLPLPKNLAGRGKKKIGADFSHFYFSRSLYKSTCSCSLRCTLYIEALLRLCSGSLWELILLLFYIYIYLQICALLFLRSLFILLAMQYAHQEINTLRSREKSKLSPA